MKKAALFTAMVFVTLLAGAFFLRTEICLATQHAACFAIPSEALTGIQIHQGEQFSIQGEGASGLCRVLNSGKPCETRTWKVLKRDQFVWLRSGRVDLSIFPSAEYGQNNQFPVLIGLTSDETKLLVTRPRFPKNSGEDILSSLYEFINKQRKDRFSFIYAAYREMPGYIHPYRSLYPFLEFSNEYKIHSGLAERMLVEMGKPMSITNYEPECPEGVLCGFVAGLSVQDYKPAKRAAKLGMGILPYLETASRSQNDYLVMRTANALGRLIPHTYDRIGPSLIPLLDHFNPEVQEQAIGAISKLEPMFETIVDKLKEMALSEPIERTPFDTGVKGMSGEILKLKQKPITHLAAAALMRVSPEDGFVAMKQLLRSDNPKARSIAVYVLISYVDHERTELSYKLPAKEKKELSLEDYSEFTQTIIQFLKNLEPNLEGEEKRSLNYALKRWLSTLHGVAIVDYDNYKKPVLNMEKLFAETYD